MNEISADTSQTPHIHCQTRWWRVHGLGIMNYVYQSTPETQLYLSCVCVVQASFCTYVQLFEDGMLLYPRKHHPHGVGPILQEGDLHSVHVVGQLLNVRLQLREGWREEGNIRRE